MKAIILAAGKSTRTMPLTATRPKSLLKIRNKEILGYDLDALNGLIDTLYVVVGYKKEMIIDFVNNYKSKLNYDIKFIEQKEQKGTGDALLSVFKKEEINDKLLVLPGDDLISPKDIRNCVKAGYCILSKTVDDVRNLGAIIEDNGFLNKIVEKPPEQITNLASTGVYVVDSSIMDLLIKVDKSPRGEYELTDAITDFARSNRMRVLRVIDYWIPITYPWSLLDANKLLLNMQESKIEGTIEEGVHISGKVVVGKGTVVKSGVYIEGPVFIGENCKIGPNCYLRAGTTIGNNCHIGQAVEVKNSIFFDNSNCAHLSYVGDSVIGFNVNLGAGFITANLRHDNKNVKSMVKGKLIDSGRRKLGAIISDNVHTGIHTSVYPGRKIWNNKTTLPGEIVRKDIE